MTTIATPASDPASFDERLQAAVAAALDTLVELAANRDDPQQARLAAAEILRFAARFKPQQPPAAPAGERRVATPRPAQSTQVASDTGKSPARPTELAPAARSSASPLDPTPPGRGTHLSRRARKRREEKAQRALVSSQTFALPPGP